MIATLIGMLLMTQVASSWLVIWKQPSPSMAHTVRSGSADLGAHGRRHREAHGAEPAGVEPGVGALVLDELRGPHLVLADAGDVDRLRARDGARCRSMTCCGRDRVRPRARRSPAGRCAFQSRTCVAPGRVVAAACRPPARALHGGDEVGEHVLAVAHDRHVGQRGSWRSRPGRCRRGSPWRPARSVDSWPVTRSSNRAPRVMSRSDFCSAVTAATVPCMPGIPRWSGWLSGHGAAGHQGGDHRGSGSARRSGAARSLAPERMTPPPTYSTGRRACADQPGRLADLLAVRPGDRAVAGQVDLRRPREGRRGLQRVLADVDQDRAGTTRSRRCGTPRRSRAGSRRVGHQVVVLGDRHRDAADVGLLEGIRADRGRRDLAGDGHHRHGVHVGVGDRRDQVGGTRAARGHADADLAGRGRRSPRPRGRPPARGGPGCAGPWWSPSAGRTPGGSRRRGCRRSCRPRRTRGTGPGSARR